MASVRRLDGKPCIYRRGHDAMGEDRREPESSLDIGGQTGNVGRPDDSDRPVERGGCDEAEAIASGAAGCLGDARPDETLNDRIHQLYIKAYNAGYVDGCTDAHAQWQRDLQPIRDMLTEATAKYKGVK